MLLAKKTARHHAWDLFEKFFPWIVILAFLLIWQLGVMMLSVSTFVLPSPIQVVNTFFENWRPILDNAWVTFTNTFGGFVLGVIGGVLVGCILGSSQLMYRGLYPLMIAFNSVPKVAITPILVLWLGIGQPPAIATAFLLCFFPIAVNVGTGLATLEPELEDLMRSFGASRIDILMKVGFPRALPYFFASLKVAITLAFVGAIISETIASDSGIGFLMMQASSQFRVPLMFAGVTVVALMGVATYAVFAVIERRMTGWATRRHTGSQQGAKLS